jgi:hypothetical protein
VLVGLFSQKVSDAAALEVLIPLTTIAEIASAAIRKRLDTIATRHAPATPRTRTPDRPVMFATALPPSDNVGVAQSEDGAARVRSFMPVSLGWRERSPRRRCR